MHVSCVCRPKRQGLSGQQCGCAGDPGGQRVAGASLWDGRENGRKRQKNRTQLPELDGSPWCRKDPGAEEEREKKERERGKKKKATGLCFLSFSEVVGNFQHVGEWRHCFNLMIFFSIII